MRTGKGICLFLMAFWVALNANATPTVVTNECLRMIIPENKILRNEINFSIKIVCSNAFDTQINVLKPSVDVDDIRDFFSFEFLAAREVDGVFDNLISKDFIAPWSVQISNDMVTPLRPNQVRSWTLHGWDIRSEDCAICGITNIACRIRTGENSWLQSPNYAIRFLNRDISTNNVVFSCLLNSHNTLKPASTFNFKVFMDTIDGQQYYFSSGLTRICAVPDNDTPLFAINNSTMQLTITFPVSRKVIKYSLQDSSITEEPL